MIRVHNRYTHNGDGGERVGQVAPTGYNTKRHNLCEPGTP